MGCNFMTFCYYRYMDKLNKIQNQVAGAFADLDAQAINEEKQYILETADLVIENAQVKNPQDQYKTLQQIMLQRGIDRDLVGTIRHARANKTTEEANAEIVKIALKPTLAKQEKRNHRIAKKLLEKGIEQFDINNQEIKWGGDFETEWRVQDLMVSLKVIFAGGYNVQKFHPRILVNVK